jgi:uncharacterized protein YerC
MKQNSLNIDELEYDLFPAVIDAFDISLSEKEIRCLETVGDLYINICNQKLSNGSMKLGQGVDVAFSLLKNACEETKTFEDICKEMHLSSLKRRQRWKLIKHIEKKQQFKISKKWSYEWLGCLGMLMVSLIPIILLFQVEWYYAIGVFLFGGVILKFMPRKLSPNIVSFEDLAVDIFYLNYGRLLKHGIENDAANIWDVLMCHVEPCIDFPIEEVTPKTKVWWAE